VGEGGERDDKLPPCFNVQNLTIWGSFKKGVKQGLGEYLKFPSNSSPELLYRKL